MFSHRNFVVVSCEKCQQSYQRLNFTLRYFITHFTKTMSTNVFNNTTGIEPTIHNFEVFVPYPLVHTSSYCLYIFLAPFFLDIQIKKRNDYTNV